MTIYSAVVNETLLATELAANVFCLRCRWLDRHRPGDSVELNTYILF
jgi:hypothetical protein